MHTKPFNSNKTKKKAPQQRRSYHFFDCLFIFHLFIIFHFHFKLESTNGLTIIEPFLCYVFILYEEEF